MTESPTGHETDAIVAMLREARIFRHMPEDEVARVVEHVLDRATELDPAVLVVPVGGEVFRGGEPADSMAVILQGEFEERSAAGDTLLWERTAGDVVGEEALFAEDPELGPGNVAVRVSSLRCVRAEQGRGRVLLIRQRVAEELVETVPSFAVGVLRGTATDAYRLFQGQRELDLAMKAYFRDQSARLEPGPYCAEGVDMTVVFARTRSQTYCNFLPRGMWPIPGFDGVFMIVFAKFRSICQPEIAAAPSFAYDETTLFIPALAATSRPPFVAPVFYTPALYPDNVMATLLGREIYGFPKRPARTVIDQHNGRATLHVDGEKAVQLRFRRAPLAAFWDAVDELPLVPSFLVSFLRGLDVDALVRTFLRLPPFLREVPVASLKQIPGAGQTSRRIDYDVNQLEMSPFLMKGIGEVEAVSDLSLSMRGNVPMTSSDLFMKAGLFLRCDFDLQLGRRLRRYGRHRDPLIL
jgi:hypothetical protein